MSASDLAKEVAILAKTYTEILGIKEEICSSNIKTGFSLNFPLGHFGNHGTCRPTKVCNKVCYGARRGRPITWINSLKKQLRVYRHFLQVPPEEIAEQIHNEYIRHKMTFLRWNGVGDLFPESAAVVGQMTKRHPDDVLLVVTRKPEMVSLIPRDAENLYLMFSLDGSKESVSRKADALRRRHPRMYFSFLRRRPDEDTMGARIVFNAQQSKKVLPYDDFVTVCPVDADRIPVKGACTVCRKCFRPDVLDGSKHDSVRAQIRSLFSVERTKRLAELTAADIPPGLSAEDVAIDYKPLRPRTKG